MSIEPRLRARQQLVALLDLLRHHPDPARAAPLIELGEQLERAIASFHMEAIRFRMFTLGRHLREHQAEFPTAAHTLYEEIRGALEAAGFHTRSMPT